jgi:hypothetical protein
MSLALHKAFAGKIKEHTVATARGDDPGDIPPIVIWERGGKPVAVAQVDQVDRDLGLEALHRGRIGYGATSATFIVDAHQTHTVINPTTGERWAPGEMQDLCDREGACEIGLLTDCLMLVHYRAKGDAFWSTSMPYHVDKAAHEVHWQNDKSVSTEEEQEDLHLDGYVPDVIRVAFKENDLFTELLVAGRLPADMGVVEIRSAMDSATSKALHMLGCNVRYKDAEKFLSRVAADGVASMA